MIKAITLSLLEKDTSVKLVKKGEEPFIRRASAIIDIEKFLEKPQDIFEDENDFIKTNISMFFAELQKNNDGTADSLGIWIEKDNKVYANSIDLKLLEGIKKYGSDNIDPIYEFYEMTIKNYEE